jgi:hypothetical protein
MIVHMETAAACDRTRVRRFGRGVSDAAALQAETARLSIVDHPHLADPARRARPSHPPSHAQNEDSCSARITT